MRFAIAREVSLIKLVAASLLTVMVAHPGQALGGSEVLATIDGVHVITADDLSYCYERLGAPPPRSNEITTALNDLLDTMITGKVLTLEAAAAGYDQDRFYLTQIENHRRFLLRSYVWREIEDGIAPGEEEAKAFYEKWRKRRLYSFIETEDRETAEEVYAALEAGRPWEELLAEYTTFEYYRRPGGGWDLPMEYVGDEASEALFTVKQPGEYTGVVEITPVTWHIYRLDKIVHGSGQSYEAARADVKLVLRNVEGKKRYLELARQVREVAPIRRDEELWQDILTSPLEELPERHFGKDSVVSEVGDLPVYFYDLFTIFDRVVALPPEKISRIRLEKPEQYEQLWLTFLEDLENDALLEYRAVRKGIDRTPEFEREMTLYADDLLIEKFYRGEFLATVPAPTEEEIRFYFESHKEDFFTGESVNVYLVAMPDGAKLEDFYAEIKAGADLVVTGEARLQSRAEAEAQLAEPPPPLPPEKDEWLGVVTVAKDPPPDGETELAAELRPRVYPFEQLNELSEVFHLQDGRGAFYKPIYHQPAKVRTLEEPEVTYYCRKKVQENKIASPEVSAAAEAWLQGLRNRHDVVVYEDVLATTAERLKLSTY